MYSSHQVKSGTLCNIVSSTLQPYLKGYSYIRLIQCFLNPGLMLQQEESSNPLRDVEVDIELMVDGNHQMTYRYLNAFMIGCWSLLYLVLTINCSSSNQHEINHVTPVVAILSPSIGEENTLLADA